METKIKEIIAVYNGEKEFLIPIIQDVQREFNYLPKEALNLVSVHMDTPISRIYEIVTFYQAFSLEPRGRNHLSLCVGTACHVRGAPAISEEIERTLEIKAGNTTADLEFTFETVNCVGACALAPILMVNNEYNGQMTISKSGKLLKKLAKKVKSDDEN